MGKFVVHSDCYCQIYFLKCSADTSDMGYLSPLFCRGVGLLQSAKSFQNRASFKFDLFRINGNVSLDERAAILNMRPIPINVLP